MDRSLRRTVASTILTGIPGPRLAPSTRRFLTGIRPGGFVLFSRNYTGDPRALRELCDELHRLGSGLPPLIAIDHEGGRVQRLGTPFTHFPAPRLIGEKASGALALRVGVAMGRELRAAGIDLSFAPVLDLDTNRANPVIGDRAFGAQPGLVARLGAALARGLRSGGVLACGKHFPGHGDTDLDSHHALPTVTLPRSALARRELLPFRRAIAAGVPALMTAHVLYPALDPSHPATLSRAILTGLLRRTLGFRGTLMTDDLEMGALGAPPAESAVRALAAGADALLVCHGLDRLAETIQATVRAVERGELPRRRVVEAACHLERLRRSAARLARDAPEPDVIGSDRHLRLAEIAAS